MKSDIVILGGGFAGLWAALTAAREFDQLGADQTVTLVSASPYLTIRPRLYEAEPEKLRVPLAPSLEPAGVTCVQGEAESVAPDERTVSVNTANGSENRISYQRLIIATGSKMHLPPIQGLANHAWSIDDYASAKAFDAHLALLDMQSGDSASNRFAIIGAGFTGIELACEMRDRIAAHHGEEAAQNAELFLLDQASQPGASLGSGPIEEIKQALEATRVQFRGGADITCVTGDSVAFATGEKIAAHTIVATTGLAACLPSGLDSMASDSQGRLVTNDWLQLQECDSIFAAGDSAYARVDDTHHALMSCQHAMPMGRHAGYNAAHHLMGLQMRAYRQPTYQTCLDLGRAGAVLTLGWNRKVKKTGSEAGELKRNINTKWIYPPVGAREEIFDAANIDKPPVR